MYKNLSKINWKLSYTRIKNLFESLITIIQYIARPSND